MSSLPPNLAEALFRTLYPDHELLQADGYYATYYDGGLVMADTVAGLARSLAELNGAPKPEADMAVGVRITFPAEHSFIGFRYPLIGSRALVLGRVAGERAS